MKMIRQVLSFFQDLLLWLSLSFHRLRHGDANQDRTSVIARSISWLPFMNQGALPAVSPNPSNGSSLSLRSRQRRQTTLFDIARPLPMPQKRKTLVLDLDETLIHSTTKAGADFHVKIEILVEHSACAFFVSKRPHCDHFLNVVSGALLTIVPFFHFPFSIFHFYFPFEFIFFGPIFLGQSVV